MKPHLITLPTGFPVGPVNAYLLEGDPLTLIDTGPKNPETLAALEAGLAKRNVRVEDIRQIILTHHHVDHVGLAKTIVERSGAKVVSHPFNIPYLANYEAERVRQFPFYNQIWAEAGTPPEIVTTMSRSNENISRWLDPVGVDETIDEGDTVTIGGTSWHVYHTPGHAGGLVCLFDADSKEMIANDHFLRDISSNPVMEPPPTGGAVGGANALRPKRLVEYLHHMERMAALEPVVAYPGHGELVTDVQGLVRKRKAFHQRRADKIHATLGGQALTLWELTQPMFPKIHRGMDFFLAHSEVLGHLDLLLEADRVAVEMDGPLMRWKALVGPD
jgi:glyoxylase-like metal-dependent hydrolase (beta-lactamase superfamily II)